MLFLQGDPTIKEDAWELLKAADSVVNHTSASNLRVLLKCNNVISEKEVGRIMAAYKRNSWKQSVSQLKAVEPAAFQAMMEINLRYDNEKNASKESTGRANEEK